MEVYICPKCNKQFKQKNGLIYHINKSVCTIKENECHYCANRFTTKTAMYKHMRKVCKVKIDDDNSRDEIFNRLIKLEEDNKRLLKLEAKSKMIEKENKILKAKMANIEKGNIIKNANTTININNGVINNIGPVAYGSEDLSRLDKTELLKALRNGYNATLKLTETVHFNPKYPKFHNVYIANMKDKYAMMYDGANWTLTTKNDLINRIYDDKKNYIEENLEEFVELLTLSQKRALDRWVNTDEEDNKIKDLKERIKLLLYNSKHVPIETQKTMIKDAKIKTLMENKKN